MGEKIFKRRLARIQKKGEQYKKIRELEESYSEYMPAKKERKVSNIMLVVIVIAIVGYALANFWLQYHTGMEMSSTLTGCWYAFWGTEIVALAAIRTSKTKHSHDNYQFEDMDM